MADNEQTFEQLPENEKVNLINNSYAEKYGFHDSDDQYIFKSRKGLNEEVVAEISLMKHEPEWMTARRLEALEIFRKKPMPQWGGGGALNDIDFDEIYYYMKASEGEAKSWDDVPEEIKRTFDRLGIPEAEQKFLSGVGAQYECLRGDARVYTGRGLVPIEAVKEGDIVFSFDEVQEQIVPATVKATAYKGEREVFEVSVGTRTIHATANHPFLALTYRKEAGKQRGRYTREWKYLEDLQPGDLVALAKQLPDVGQPHTLLQPEIKTEVIGEHAQVAGQNAGSVPEPIPTELDNAFIGFAKITNITPAGVAPVYDIEVDGPHNFVAEGLIVHNSEVVYHNIKKELEEKGVIFLSTDHALQQYPELFEQYFGTVIPSSDNKFAALNTAVWSGGSFIYVPKGVKIDMPLQAYFRINAQSMGQFERTLIIADEGSWVHYVEGCFLAGARVRTRSGEKPIEEIKVGDEVLTHKGRYRKVYNTMERPYEGTVYHIRFFGDSSRELHVTEEHPLLVVQQEAADNQDFTPGWVAACQLKVGDFLVAPIAEAEAMLEMAASVSAAPHTLVGLGDTPEGNYLYFPVETIDLEQQRTTVYNFAVEEDETYVCEGVASHNCTAPNWTEDSLHSAVVEIIVKKGARVRYTTIQNWSNNVYNLVTKRAICEEGATMEWVDGNIGCLAEGSTVTTPDGIKAIESLEVGDEVLSYDDQAGELVFRRVLAKKFSGYQPIHTVSVGERKLNVTANHPFYSYTYNPDAPKKLGRYNLAYVRAEHLEEAIIPRTSIEYGVPYALKKPELVTEFQSLNQYASDLTMTRARETRLAELGYTTDEIMWLFGYWTGDGNIEVKEAQTEGVIRWAKVGFSTPRTDRARPRLMDTMTALVEAEPTERADGHHLSWNSKELAELFALNGFVGKAIDKRVPSWVWSLPESQRLAFVAGYLDADGMVVEENRRFGLKSANRQLLEDVASLLVTLGITSRLHTEFSEPRTVTILGYECTAHGSYRLTFPLDARLIQHVSPRLREEAEASEPAKLIHNRTVGRSQIELPESVEIVNVNVSEASAELVPTWDIEVEGTGNFVSQGFIVHNSKLTMKYPAVYMMGPYSHGEILSIAFAGKGQHQDAGAKVIHAAPHTSSIITSKSISKDGGRAGYRGLVQVLEGAYDSKSSVVCDALILDEESRSDTYPYIDIREDDVSIGHEATVSKVGEEQLFYLMSRGVSEEEALSMIVSGFIEPIVKELPMEYAVEMNRLIQLEMEGSVG